VSSARHLFEDGLSVDASITSSMFGGFAFTLCPNSTSGKCDVTVVYSKSVVSFISVVSVTTVAICDFYTLVSEKCELGES